MTAVSLKGVVQEGPSDGVWADCPLDDIRKRGNGVIFEYEGPDVTLAANQTEARVIGTHPFYAYTGGTGGTTIAPLKTVHGGAVVLSSTTDNEGCALRTLPQFKIAAGQGRLWFEARVKVDNITDSRYSIFVGLLEDVACTIETPLDKDTDTIANQNLVGLLRVFADGDKLDSVYKADGVTAVTVGADAVAVVADTYVNIGMRFDGSRLYFYKNGVELADSKAISGTAGTDFPSDVFLGTCIALMLGHADTGTLTMRFLRCVQERPNE